MKNLLRISFLILLISYLHSCTTVDIYEKSITIPGHEWKSDFRPSFNFTIRDSSTPYNIFLVLRHTEKYSFNNIYVNLYVKGPGQDSTEKFQGDLKLGDNEKGWLGTGMDDIYEHRVLLAKGRNLKTGDYTFTIEQIMREDPLKNVLNAGLRLEKEK